MNHFVQIQKALEYIGTNFKSQPDLDEVAKALHMSPMHLQKVFTEWAGVSPKKFLQHVSIEHAKELLKKGYSTQKTALETGLSGTGRLHDLFMTIEAMTPGEYKDGGKNLTIEYSFPETVFGTLIVASTDRGICYVGYGDNPDFAVPDLKRRFPNATYQEKKNEKHTEIALAINHQKHKKVNLHLKGTPFQLKVWEALCRIPEGNYTTYGRLAEEIGHPRASRAVGSAVGDNHISILIPCHRVIQSTGTIGSYHWGSIKKTAVLGWEGARNKKYTTTLS